MKRKPQRGGKRCGAGRPPAKPTQVISVRLFQDEIAYLERHGKRPAERIRELVRALAQKARGRAIFNEKPHQS